jgi:hypothetical protein
MMCRSPSLQYASSQKSNETKTKDLNYVQEANHDMLQKVLEMVEDLSARVNGMQSTKSRPPADIFKPLPEVRLSGVTSITLPEEDSSPLPVRHSLNVSLHQPAILTVEKEDDNHIHFSLDPLHPDVHRNYVDVLQTFSHEILPDSLSWSANTPSGRMGEMGGQHLDLQSRYAQAYLLLQCTQAASKNPQEIGSLINAVNAIALYEMQRVIDIHNEFPYQSLASELSSSENLIHDSISTYSCSSYDPEETHAPLFLQQSGQVSMESVELQEPPVGCEVSQSSYLPLLEYKVQLMQSPSVPCFKTAGYIEDISTPIYEHVDGHQKHLSIKKCQSALELASFAYDDEFDNEPLTSGLKREQLRRGLLETEVHDDGFGTPGKIPVVLCEAFDEPQERRNGNEFLFALPRSESSISSFRPISKSLASARIPKSSSASKNPKFVQSLVKKKSSFAKLFATATGKQL